MTGRVQIFFPSILLDKTPIVRTSQAKVEIGATNINKTTLCNASAYGLLSAVCSAAEAYDSDRRAVETKQGPHKGDVGNNAQEASEFAET